LQIRREGDGKDGRGPTYKWRGRAGDLLLRRTDGREGSRGDGKGGERIPPKSRRVESTLGLYLLPKLNSILYKTDLEQNLNLLDDDSGEIVDSIQQYGTKLCRKL